MSQPAAISLPLITEVYFRVKDRGNMRTATAAKIETLQFFQDGLNKPFYLLRNSELDGSRYYALLRLAIPSTKGRIFEIPN
jgi:hypothetical protein